MSGGGGRVNSETDNRQTDSEQLEMSCKAAEVEAEEEEDSRR